MILMLFECRGVCLLACVRWVIDIRDDQVPPPHMDLVLTSKTHWCPVSLISRPSILNLCPSGHPFLL